MYQGLLAGVIGGADALTQWLQNGRLRWYVGAVMVTAAGAAWASMSLAEGGARWWEREGPFHDRISIEIIAMAALMVIGAVVTALSSTRLMALTALGMVGVGIAGTFAFSGGPDLAMTQISADALTIVLFLIAFRHLPDLRTISSAATRVRDAVIAVAVGGAMAALTHAAATRQLADPISSYFSRYSVERGYGQNVVNVILVDFRAFDTLGEITVIVIAAIGVFTLLAVQRGTSGEPGVRDEKEVRA